MRRYTVPVLFAFILLMSMFTSLSGSSQAESLSGIGEWDLRDIEPFDWSGWDQDTDDNGIDDLLQGDLSELDGDGELIGINIHFSHYPAPVDVQRIVSMVSTLQFHHVGKYSTAAYLSIPGKDVPDLLSLMNEDITMLEYRPPMVNSLDISTPATRSGQSEEYSPMTAWELGYSGEGMVVAVIDSGVDNSLHESLRGKFVFGVDFTGTTVIYGLDPDDIDGHGTHVAGTVMGTGGAVPMYLSAAPP
ncbi:MAG: S8 family serine peptidase, partial [Candidatus Thermoplasmatota archaeon]|nr:S8 family serine peptidase [Candidatus Thermoplasmatota archaeon]